MARRIDPTVTLRLESDTMMLLKHLQSELGTSRTKIVNDAIVLYARYRDQADSKQLQGDQ